MQRNIESNILTPKKCRCQAWSRFISRVFIVYSRGLNSPNVPFCISDSTFAVVKVTCFGMVICTNQIEKLVHYMRFISILLSLSPNLSSFFSIGVPDVVQSQTAKSFSWLTRQSSNDLVDERKGIRTTLAFGYFSRRWWSGIVCFGASAPF